MRRFLLILVVLGVIAGSIVEWGNAVWTQPSPVAPKSGETVILIKPGTRLHDIAQQLEKAGVTNFGLMFEANLRARGLASQVKAGEYAIPAHASMADIAAILVAGKSIQHKLTAAEGLTSRMIYDLVVQDPALTGEAGPVPAEGSLLPETYLFTLGHTRAALLEEMARAQEKFLAAEWPGRVQGLPYTTQRQAVILASIVEKETSLPEERRHIASVFVNRLRLGMALQSDPTIIYALTKGYPLGHGMRQSELALDSPYNSYRNAGLPPGPISNPGKDSLSAVLHPEDTKDLYFVASGTGGHVFSADIAEHERNVAALRTRERGIRPVEGIDADKLPPVTAQPSLQDAGALPALPKPAARHRRHHG